jgi:hypothetical protein
VAVADDVLHVAVYEIVTNPTKPVAGVYLMEVSMAPASTITTESPDGAPESSTLVTEQFGVEVLHVSFVVTSRVTAV